MSLHVVAHPLCSHLVTQLRDQDTPPALFRAVTRQLTTLLALEATHDLPLRLQPIQTPLEPLEGRVLARGLALVPVLRAGLSMVEPFVELFPDVALGHIGLVRDHDTAIASSYYCKLPPTESLGERVTLVLDPMLATGGSACLALEAIKAGGATDIRLICVVAAPEGVARVEAEHPEIPIIAAALDRELNDRKYILPGLGDFGDRLYGTM